jgi:hypothetical protein
MPLRAWAFSFDGFGGHGHVFPEIWNRQQAAWQLVDIFNNVYLTTGGSDRPLSALDLRKALLAGDTSLRSVPLAPSARAGFRFEAKLWDYYRRGLPEWYLWWGNNPFDYERAAAVRALAPLSRSLAQVGAVVHGVQPQAHALATPDNAPQRRAMGWLRLHLLVASVTVVAGLVLLLMRRPRGAGRQHEGTAHAL